MISQEKKEKEREREREREKKKREGEPERADRLFKVIKTWLESAIMNAKYIGGVTHIRNDTRSFESKDLHMWKFY